jgi:hypothetical protein
MLCFLYGSDFWLVVELWKHMKTIKPSIFSYVLCSYLNHPFLGWQFTKIFLFSKSWGEWCENCHGWSLAGNIAGNGHGTSIFHLPARYCPCKLESEWLSYSLLTDVEWLFIPTATRHLFFLGMFWRMRSTTVKLHLLEVENPRKYRYERLLAIMHQLLV